MNRRAREETDLLPAQWAWFLGLHEFERAGAADTHRAAGGELGIRSVVETDEAFVLIILCDFRVARHGHHRSNAVGHSAHGPSEKDELIFLHAVVFEIELGRKAEPYAIRLHIARTANDNSCHAGNRFPGQTLGVIDGDRHILNLQRRAAEALLRPGREIVRCPRHKHERFAFSIAVVDASGLWVEGHVKAKIHAV